MKISMFGLRQPAAAFTPAARCGASLNVAAGCDQQSGSGLPQSKTLHVIIFMLIGNLVTSLLAQDKDANTFLLKSLLFINFILPYWRLTQIRASL